MLTELLWDEANEAHIAGTGSPVTLCIVKVVFAWRTPTAGPGCWSLKNGVFQMKERSEIWLFVTERKQPDRVQYLDKLESDKLYWQGQTSGRTDSKVINHERDGNALLVFYRESKSEHPGAGFRLVGPFRYASHNGPPPTDFVLERR